MSASPIPQASPPREAELQASSPSAPPPKLQTWITSDRIWGYLSLPSSAGKQLRQVLSEHLTGKKQKPFTVTVYGDSHTQGGYFGQAMGQRLSQLITGSTETAISPGWVTVNHPMHGAPPVIQRGVWLRQNWLYASDQGPFGPLGLAFVTQDRAAELELQTQLTSPSTVTFYFEQTGRELPFCLTKSSGDQSAPTSTEEVCHDPTQGQATEDSLGKITVQLDPQQALKLTLKGGQSIPPKLLTLRKKNLVSAKRKRARLKKKMPRLSREQIREQLKLPSYASTPHLLFPSQPHLRVFGFHLHIPSASVEVNSMGVRGATIWSPATQSDPSLFQWHQKTAPDLFVLWFGTNTAARETTNINRYRERFRSFIQSLKRANSSSACLIILPPDFGRREQSCFLDRGQRRLLARKSRYPSFLEALKESRYARVCDPDSLINPKKRGRHRFPVPEVRSMGEWDKYRERCRFAPPPLLHSLALLQKEIGLAEGCAVYDTLTAMKDTGGVEKWACSTERWAQYDLVHLTPHGYQNLGKQLADGVFSTLDQHPRPPEDLGPHDDEPLSDSVEPIPVSTKTDL